MAQIRKGMAILYKDEPHLVLDFKHTHKGRGGATITVKLKNIVSGNVITATFKADEDVEEVPVDRHEAVYSYRMGDTFVFFDNQTYEEVHFSESDIEHALGYLKEGMEVKILYADNKPITIELPTFVEMEVVETEPNFKGDTASGGTKPAKIETGKVIKVPFFIETGDIIKIDTRDDRYIERVGRKK